MFKIGDKVRLKSNWKQINADCDFRYKVSTLEQQERTGDMIVTETDHSFANVTPDIGYRYRYELLELAKEENEI